MGLVINGGIGERVVELAAACVACFTDSCRVQASPASALALRLSTSWPSPSSWQTAVQCALLVAEHLLWLCTKANLAQEPPNRCQH